MRIGAVLSPVQEWSAIVEAARVADDVGLDAVSFWDHYHSPKPEWGYVCGWSAYGYLAALTSQVKFVPMVLNNLHYEPGVLAKESSILAIASGGRFELGIGAGDWPDSFAAWGRPYPDANTRIAVLAETLSALRRLWAGEAVTVDGQHVRLVDAICTPAPAVPPRVVIGVGSSRRTLRTAIEIADEVNVYAEPAIVKAAREEIDRSARSVDISLFLGWEMDKWPSDPARELGQWSDFGVDRFLINVGAADMTSRIRQLGPLQTTVQREVATSSPN